AAYALGQPETDDALAARRGQPAPQPVATDITAADTASGKIGRFRRPATLDEALDILAAEPETQLVAGATDFGVEVNIKGVRAKSVLAIDRLAELRGIQYTDDYIELGAAHTLSELERELAGSIPLLGSLFPQFASGPAGPGSPTGTELGPLPACRRPSRLFHRLPTNHCRRRRTDQRDPRPAAAGTADLIPKDRQTPFRRYLLGCDRLCSHR